MNSLTQGPGADPSDGQRALDLIARHHAELTAFLADCDPLPHVYGDPASKRFPRLVAYWSGIEDWREFDAHVQAFETWLGREVTEAEAADLIHHIDYIQSRYRFLSEVLGGEGVYIPWRSEDGIFGYECDYEFFYEGDHLSDLRAKYERQQAGRSPEWKP